MALTCVGTTDYISPEVLRANNARNGIRHGVECDLWSLGVLIHECLVGEPPFMSQSLMETFDKIERHEVRSKSFKCADVLQAP